MLCDPTICGRGAGAQLAGDFHLPPRRFRLSTKEKGSRGGDLHLDHGARFAEDGNRHRPATHSAVLNEFHARLRRLDLDRENLAALRARDLDFFDDVHGLSLVRATGKNKTPHSHRTCRAFSAK